MHNVISAKQFVQLLAVSLLFVGSQDVRSEILLYTETNEFRGCLDCSKYDSDSVCNRYGNFGSRYSGDSIWNRYGAGGRYNSDSPFSRYGTGLKMVDSAGNFYGYFSRSLNGERRIRIKLRQIWDATSGDYSDMRDIFCGN